MRRRSAPPLCNKKVQNIRSGQELYELLTDSADPGTVESILTDSQKNLLSDYARKKNEEEREKLKKRFDDAWVVAQEDFKRRSVVKLQRYRVTDFKISNKKERKETILTFWKPSDDVGQNLKEGTRIKMYNLNSTHSRYRHLSSHVQISTTSQTKYEVLPGNLDSFTPRKVTQLKSVRYETNKEMDIVCIIVEHGSPKLQSSEKDSIYVSDGGETFVQIRFYGGMKMLRLQDTLKVGNIVAFRNLLRKSGEEFDQMVICCFTDLSSASRCPREGYLQSEFQRLEQVVKACSDLVSNLKVKLAHRTPNIGKYYRTYTAVDLDATAHVLKSETDILEDDFTYSQHEAMEEDAIDPKLKEQRERNAKRIQSLARYGTPPPLKGATTIITPLAKREFRPPTRR